MGIQSEFNYGIGLCNYSFAFSNLNNDEESEKQEFEKHNSSFEYLASISRELFNIKALNIIPVKTNIFHSWAFTCL